MPIHAQLREHLQCLSQHRFDYDIYNFRYHNIVRVYICQSLFSKDYNNHKLITQYQLF